MSIDWISQPATAPDAVAQKAAFTRQQTLTKPAGSLGRLEELAIRFAAWQGRSIPELQHITIRVFAADHGVCDQGVSAFPAAVTGQMIDNFLSGGAAISVLANQLNADFSVVNMGTLNPPAAADALCQVQIAPRSNDFTVQTALTQDWLERALNAGREQITHLNNCELFIGGEMGIGNTSSASAIYSAVLGLSSADSVGPGTGLDANGQSHKAAIIAKALELHKPMIQTEIDVLRCFGGFDIAALTGAYIAAAQAKIPVLVDGFICTAAALLASRINPSILDWMLFSHQSAEPAHSNALIALDQQALLNLNMRLGEGSGAAIAVPIIQNALLLHRNMATFADAGVSEKDV